MSNVPQAQPCDYNRHYNIEASVLVGEKNQSIQQAGYRARKEKERKGMVYTKFATRKQRNRRDIKLY